MSQNTHRINPDYKAKYPSYNNYKSKGTNVSINKLKCINTNLNINGNNTGDINLGNKGQIAAAEEGDLSASSFGGGGNDGERYYDGYSKKDKGIDCTINNNNNNTNIVTGGGGNQTIPPEPTITCEECFIENLAPEELTGLNERLAEGIQIGIDGEIITVNSLTELCKALQDADVVEAFNIIFVELGITPIFLVVGNIVLCLDEIFDFDNSALQ